MQLGFVSAIVPELSLEEVFAVGKASGYSWVELMCWPTGKADRRYAGVTHVDVTSFTPADAEHVHSLARKHSMRISGLGYYPNILMPDQEASNAAAEHLKHVISAAKLLGLPVVNTFIGRDWTKSVDDNWPRFMSVWPDLIAFAEQQEVRIAIENCAMLFTKDEWPGGKNLAFSPAIWRRMFKDIPSKYFGLNYDPSHPCWMQMDYIAPLKEFASRIFHVHLKDVAVDRKKLNDVSILAYPLEFHTPKLPGRGDIDWPLFLRAVKEIGYDGPTCVEVEDRDFEGSLEDRKKALVTASNFLLGLNA